MVAGLYNFFKLSAVKVLYSGRLPLKRLITTKWSGHFAAVKVIKACHADILSDIQAATTETQLKADQRVTAKGLISQLEDSTNRFLLEFLFDLLTLSFQSSKSVNPQSPRP